MTVYKITSARRVGPSPWLVPAIFLDLALVTAFTMVGRMIHGYDLGFLGVSHTAWPFLVGMLLRFVSGQGVALPFVIVALVFTGVVLLGWRAIAKPFARRSALLSS